MESLLIKPTADTPRITFDGAGDLMIEGRSLPENPNQFYGPLLEWAASYNLPELRFHFKLEYFNTASSKLLFELIKALRDNTNIKNLMVRWNYEEGDVDSLETGHQYSALLKIPFEFIECAESSFGKFE